MNLAVEFKGLNKAFNGVYANADLHLKVKKGSIHAIVGENGAGKSTAMKMLYGIYQPDSGSIFVNGKLWGNKGKPWSSPSDAIACGIGMVHQHFMLGGSHTVLDNIILGVEQSRDCWKWLPRCLRPIDRQSARKKLEVISAQFGFLLDWDAPVEELPVGIQQKIEILKLLFHNAQILILDEPTAVLTPQETSELFPHLKKLSQEGKTILLITHKLKEVLEIANQVTVFRAGKVVGEREIQDTHVEDLAMLMVGRKVKLESEVLPRLIFGPPILEMKKVGLQGPSKKLEAKGFSGAAPGAHKLKDLTFQIHGGEIVGICGVEGNGQSELLQVLLHPREYLHCLKGSISILSQDIKNFSTEKIKFMGVGVIPEDRHRDGLLLGRPIQESFLLGLQRRRPFSQWGMISSKTLAEETGRAVRDYNIQPQSITVDAGALSGGNQQKLIIAREFYYSPHFLIAAQPTRGVDVGAIEFIHRRILKARAEGSGILLISSELEEILALSDRILVMYEGKIVAEFQRGEVTEKVLGLRMGGAMSV